MRISDWSSDVCSSDLPLRELAQPTKRTAMGRFNHENVAFMASTDRRVAFYMGDDTTPGCIYKFVPDRAYSDTNRAANTRSEEHTSELQSLMRISYAVFCLNKKTNTNEHPTTAPH